MQKKQARKDEIFFEVPAGCHRLRADKVLHASYPEFSRSQIQRLFACGLVWRDNTVMIKSQKVSTGDCMTFSLPPVQPVDLRPVAILLNVLYEDNHLVAVNKPAGMVVHPGHGTGKDTLVHALLHHCQGSLSGIGGVERPGIVHRLDKETSGVIVAAKTDRAFLHLSKLFAERQIGKEYLALVRGVPHLESGSIREPIARHPLNRLKMAVSDRGRSAHSDWEKVETFGQTSALLRVHIHTGRTHQIRVHLAHQGHPVVGDRLYGSRGAIPGTIPSQRMFLHAHRLTFTHPVSVETLTLTAELPEDFSASLGDLRRQRLNSPGPWL